MDTTVPCQHRSRFRRHAFTLIELLVVLGIIAVLIGILVPSLAKSRKLARTTLCQSNARQIMISINAFATDNAGRLPENRIRVGDGQHATWKAKFVEKGYIPSGPVWQCKDRPSDLRSELGTVDNDTMCVADEPANYALNGHVLWRRDTIESEAKRADTAIDRPSHTILLAETTAPWPDIRVINQLLADDANLFGYWHAGKGTYGFLDGHAELINLMDSGNPDCRWHNGKDLTTDTDFPQPLEQLRQHAHSDWEFLLSEVYLRRR